MRCKNCGWPNKPQVKTCVKCHAPLDQTEMSQPVPPQRDFPNETSSAELQKTVLESESFGYDSGNDVNVSMGSKEGKVCSKCGYLLRIDAVKCPNCNFPVSGVHPTFEKPQQNTTGDFASQRPTRVENQAVSNVNYRGTINPYMMTYEPEPTFILKPLKRMNERKDFEDIEFEGREVVLTRSNTEANNSSITSKEQAVISRMGGHWFIDNLSEQKTTFIQVSNKLQLHEGDIILLGNRLFEFHE